MDIYIDGNKYGVEIPEMTLIVHKMRAKGHTKENLDVYERVLNNNTQLIEKLSTFLLQNGVLTPHGNPLAAGVIGFDFTPDSLMGFTFYGSEVLAQKVAAAFPTYKVIAAHDGKVITPAAQAAPTPAKPKPAPGL